MMLHYLLGTLVPLLCVFHSSSGDFRIARTDVNVCLRREQQFEVSPWMPLTTFTPFIVDLSFPPSVIVGETFHAQISIYNVLNTSLPVSVEFETSSDYEVLTPACTICVPAQEKISTAVSVRAEVGGKVQLKLRAFIDAEFPGQCGPSVATSKIYHISSPIIIAYEGFLAETTWTKYICTYDLRAGESFIPLLGVSFPDDIVENSGHAWMTLTGDLLGPTLENLGHLIRLPSGCGEQSMSKHAPNIYLLQYLIASNQATPQVTEELKAYIKIGYERELSRYRLNDGSYSFFGYRNGSTWLTAFVVKTYAQSRPFIAVDPLELSASTAWLRSQQLSSGCFKRVGHVHNQRMMGLSQGGAPGVLTAYVMAALLEAGEDSASPVITQSVSCIEAASAPGSEDADDIYFLALKAYAYSLAGLPQTEDVISELLAFSTEDEDGLFWRMRSVNGFNNDALSVETTSYVLLAILNLNLPGTHEEGRKIVKWLTSMMNSQGGFLSTQDTVLALQALALFEAHESQEPVDLSITLYGASQAPKTIEITESNKLEPQRVDIEQFPTFISALLDGSGCVLLQATMRYNVKDPEPSDVFTVSVEAGIDYDAEICPTFNIEICVTYHLVKFQSNMGIIEVTLVSGYIPDNDDLELIGAVQRYEVDGSKVVFYFDEFTATETCIEFKAFRESEVDDVRPGTVRVYDYYEPDFYVSEVLPFRTVFCRN